MDIKLIIREFMRFGIVGGICTALHYGIYYILQMHINKSEYSSQRQSGYKAQNMVFGFCAIRKYVKKC